MLDTIILKLPPHQVDLSGATSAEIGRWTLHGSDGGFKRYINNPTAKDKAASGYLPRLTLIKQSNRTDGKFLKVEFSAPKLLFGNNVEELTEGDFQAVVMALREKLGRMGVGILAKHLESAAVTAFHPSKNFPLSDGYTASYIISDLGKVGLTRRLDMAKVTFANDGKSLQFYSAAHSVVFYDKIADLAKTKGRATDKDQTHLQSSLFEAPGSTERPPEILRMEVRLSKKRKMNEMLSQLGLKENPTFREVFDDDLCRKLLRSYWTGYVGNRYAFILDPAGSPQMTLRSLLKQGTGPKQAVYLLGLFAACRDSPGVLGLRTVLGEHSTPRQWPRVGKDIERLNRLCQTASASPHGWRRQIEQGIETMVPYRLSKETANS
jgi:hypothetical protein